MSEAPRFSHLDEVGRAHMVDVGAKPVVRRVAVATGTLHAAPATLALLQAQQLPKGNALTVAQVAGVLAAKRTDDLIPLCHGLPLSYVDVAFAVGEDAITITATAACEARTGVEMEALTAVSVAALTLYDMMKAVDKGMVISDVRLVEKTKG